ncbi:MAG: asparagine synthase (glutamine-hydrolysing) [Parcubacteria group bacterium Licking1014_17]|nr:MAG: asparagine synthase (glutamine-hydrolysing) [Parcubacteria group bacterium Licking1014_17]
MCGIIGFNSNDYSLGREMADSIAHRGPDDWGIFSDDKITLGNRRLAIIDLSSAGHQPMRSEGNTIIVYNGEIYNFQELKKDLYAQGCRFKSDSDTEVILNGYDIYGPEIFKKMRGMWACAIYDPKNGKLYLSRDFFGIKPLFYFHDGRRLAFASEIKALIKYFEKNSIELKHEADNVRDYFILGYVPAPGTVYQNIFKLMPGETIEFNLSDSSFKKTQVYWDQASATDNFEEVIYESIKKHLIADVPVGIYLSGGIDSTSIALTLKEIGVSMKAFTVRIPGKKDADYAKKIADLSGFKHEEIDFNGDVLRETYQVCWQILDEPIADTSLLPSLAVSKLASKEVKVVLTGEGGDELFLGYDKYFQFRKLSKAKPPTFLSDIKNIRPFMRRFRSIVAKGRNDLLGAYIENARIDPAILSTKDLQNRLYKSIGNKVVDIAYFDRKMYLPDDLLYKIDFATMAYSIEGRVPFLDRSVWSFANSLPIDKKIGKEPLKNYLLKYLPPELVLRKKEGFSIPSLLYLIPDFNDDIRKSYTMARKMIPGLPEFDFLKKKHPRFIFAMLAFYKTACKFNLV